MRMVSSEKPEQRAELMDTAIVPEGAFPWGFPIGTRQTGHCGFDLNASWMQSVWKTCSHAFNATQDLSSRLSWQMTQHSFKLQDAGIATRASEGTPAEMHRGAV
mmetsp:Transcript_54657/g.116138  ORF Transcript_54657/g.116138 Transcript_54657/m.116138 type:complete len:104 (+) Transcript_54657:674-985(+)